MEGLCLDKNRQQARLVCQFLYLKAVLFVVVVFKCKETEVPFFFSLKKVGCNPDWLGTAYVVQAGLRHAATSCLCLILYVGIIVMHCHMLSQPFQQLAYQYEPPRLTEILNSPTSNIQLLLKSVYIFEKTFYCIHCIKILMC